VAHGVGSEPFGRPLARLVAATAAVGGLIEDSCGRVLAVARRHCAVPHVRGPRLARRAGEQAIGFTIEISVEAPPSSTYRQAIYVQSVLDTPGYRELALQNAGQ